MLRASISATRQITQWRRRLREEGSPRTHEINANQLREAIEAAVEAAHAAGKSGCSARVLLQATDGTWRPVWTYGLDPYPRRAREHFFGIL
jgi:hypothetical protein